MNVTNASAELFAAIAAAQSEVENATKASVNPHFKNRYADLAEVLNTVRHVFAKHKLAIIQSPSFDGAMVSVTTIIGHCGGGWIEGKSSCVPSRTDAQQIGSAVTYLRRYSLAAMCGIAQEDDDGNSVMHDKKPSALSSEVSQAIASAESVEALRDIYKSLPQAQKSLAYDLVAARKAELA